MAGFVGPLGRPRTDSRAGVAPAVWLLVLATVVVLTCLVVHEPFLLAASGVLALLMGWSALHVAWTAVVAGRDKQAVLLRRLQAKDAELSRALRRASTPTAKPPLVVRRSPVDWAGLEPDLVSSLLAWERHTAQVLSQRKAPGRDRAVG